MPALCLVWCDMPFLENCSPRTLVFCVYSITFSFSSSMGYLLLREMLRMSNLLRFVLMSHLLSNLLMDSMASAVLLAIMYCLFLFCLLMSRDMICVRSSAY